MKKEHIIVLVLAVIVVGGLVFAALTMAQDTPTANTARQAGSRLPIGETKATGATGPDDVLVELIPLGAEDGNFIVSLAANTHSVNLGNVDLMESTILVIGGERFAPVQAPKLGGHHAGGELVFDHIPEGAFSIIITGIPTSEERLFTWG